MARGISVDVIQGWKSASKPDVRTLLRLLLRFRFGSRVPASIEDAMDEADSMESALAESSLLVAAEKVILGL